MHDATGHTLNRITNELPLYFLHRQLPHALQKTSEYQVQLKHYTPVYIYVCDNALATFRTSRYISKCLAFGNAFMIGSITVKKVALGLKDTWADPRVEAAPKGGACTGRYLRARNISIAAHTPNTFKGYKPRMQEFKCVSRLVGLVGGGHYERHICVIARGTGAAEGE